MPITSIFWNVDPEIFAIGPIHLRWYGLLFATGFFLGFLITRKVFRVEKENEEWLDSLLLHLVLGAVIGARLGHVFFYGWDYYQDHLLEIPMIWQGGLASHGGGIGVILAYWLFSRNVSKKPMLWIMDRTAMSVALAGCFIRLGNLFNQEIVGIETDVPWAFVFALRDEVTRHPAQLYESLSYLTIFGILSYLFWKTPAKKYSGLLTGLCFALIFIARFIIEFWKENQEAFEDGMAYNMGQLLSIPMVILGLTLVILAFRKKTE